MSKTVDLSTRSLIGKFYKIKDIAKNVKDKSIKYTCCTDIYFKRK